MPLDILNTVYTEGTAAVPGWRYLRVGAPALLAVAATKYYFGGSQNTWGLELHGKVYLVTGGTAGLGALVAEELAARGAQVVLLVRSTRDAWTVDFVEQLRARTNNFMVYAEECDLALLHSVRLFATQWLDNQPPRRLDGVVCCAGEALPMGRRQASVDGAERQIAVNYLAHYHLLTLLKPLLTAQPPDRDVRVVVVTCSLQAMAAVSADDVLWERRVYPAAKPWVVYGTLKLLLGLFGRLFQRRLAAYERKDRAPCNVRLSIVNPGLMRTPSTRRVLTAGTVWGLVVWVLLYPVWWLFFKDAVQGSQSVLFALFAPVLGAQDGGNLIQECQIVTDPARSEYNNEELQEALFDATAKEIDALERALAVERNKADKKLGADKAKAEAAKRKLEDLSVKPNTEGELDYKLSMLRKSMGIAAPLGPETCTQGKSEGERSTGTHSESGGKRSESEKSTSKRGEKKRRKGKSKKT